MDSVCLYTSDVASYLGENKWSVIGSFERLLKKLIPLQYSEALLQLNETKDNLSLQAIQIEEKFIKNEITVEEHSILVEEITSEIKKTVERECKVTKTKETYITDVLGDKSKEIMESDVSNTIKKRELAKLIDKSVSKEQKETYKQDIKTFVNTAHGTKTEDYTLATYESENDVILDKSQKFYKSELFEINGIKFKVGGRMDGIDHDSRCVVEIKNRTRGLFYELRDYESTQIMIYMYLLGYESSKLVEMYKTKRTVKKHCIDVEYNKGHMDSIITRLESFCKRVIEYLDGKSVTDISEYLMKSDNEKECMIWGLIDGCENGEVIGGDEETCMIDTDSDNY
jgi:hypothetical protein